MPVVAGCRLTAAGVGLLADETVRWKRGGDDPPYLALGREVGLGHEVAWSLA
jgi:hypothetical protein